MTKKILIAKVSSPFGIKGEVRVIAYCENHLNLEKYSLTDAKGNEIKLKISNKNKAVVGTSGGDPIVIVKIEGVNDRNASEAIRNLEIFANRADFAPTKKDEFYYSDLIGLDVIDMNSKKIGKVVNVLDYGAGGLIDIEFEDKRRENFPFKNEFFPEVNLEKNFIRIEEIEMIDGDDKANK
ncbi:MAG: 16S rRNA processing protein RimM [Proteobacteria bacterium]|nr:16S rRNA processing protein RimM [Pseudomonadota bacterium]